jgi:hypothetical protein
MKKFYNIGPGSATKLPDFFYQISFSTKHQSNKNISKVYYLLLLEAKPFQITKKNVSTKERLGAYIVKHFCL